MIHKMFNLLKKVLVFFLLSSSFVFAQGEIELIDISDPHLDSEFAAAILVNDTQYTYKAKVVEVLHQEEKNIPGMDMQSIYQTLRVRIMDGPQAGSEKVVENDHLNLKEGDTFYLQHTISGIDDRESYHVSEPYRLDILLVVAILFVIFVFIFGGKQGMRGLLSLVGSLFFIYFLLFPSILKGYSPLIASIVISSFIIIVGSYVTHGFNKTTTAAVIGMIISIVITGIMAYIVVGLAHMSGFSSDESVYLNMNTGGAIDFVGLLLGGIIIGLLGVLYDASISQAIAVEELKYISKDTPRRVIFARALRIGREHIGALVNTLAIAYVGASLPLLLLFYTSADTLLMAMNREVFATEIIRTLVGSIGLILAIPITTLIATYGISSTRKNSEDNKHHSHSHLGDINS